MIFSFFLFGFSYLLYFIQVPLGILMENENTKDGMANIVDQLHQYVPGHGQCSK